MSATATDPDSDSDYDSDTPLLSCTKLTSHTPTGITEAFKADSFDKKINLGNDARAPPPPTSPEAVTLTRERAQVLAPTGTTGASRTSCPRCARPRTRSSTRA